MKASGQTDFAVSEKVWDQRLIFLEELLSAMDIDSNKDEEAGDLYFDFQADYMSMTCAAWISEDGWLIFELRFNWIVPYAAVPSVRKTVEEFNSNESLPFILVFSEELRLFSIQGGLPPHSSNEQVIFEKCSEFFEAVAKRATEIYERANGADADMVKLASLVLTENTSIN
ncbi:MAG: hypothetical protein AAB597_01455 [Patescibacteria group bacterium]